MVTIMHNNYIRYKLSMPTNPMEAREFLHLI